MDELAETAVHLQEYGHAFSQTSALNPPEWPFTRFGSANSSQAGILDIEEQDSAPKTGCYTQLRYTLMTTYRRLFSLVFVANMVAFIVVTIRGGQIMHLVNAAAVNLCLCGLARHNLVVNAIFYLVCLVPRSAPLRLRRIATKVFHYGGIHSGCGVAASVWYTAFVVVATCQYNPSAKSIAVLVLTYLILLLLLAIVVSAYPAVRFKMHDYFELTHRFAGWTVILCFWPLLMVFTSQQPSMRTYLIQQPTFWVIAILTVAIIHPWAMVRKVKVTPEVLSSHALRLHFDYTSINLGQSISISRHPLRDWHSFAGFPDKFDSSNTGFSLVISKAGDWTSDIIQNPPTYIYKRGVPTTGFIYVMRMYSRIILIATGSGIGPCLSFLSDDHRPTIRVLWQTRTPLKTYGERLIGLVHRLDPHPVVLDTTKSGRADMLPVVMKLYQDFYAEAVCVISNPKMTKQLVYDLERRQIPAFGPIFDS